MRLSKVLSKLREGAETDNRPIPIIETDIDTAFALAEILAEDIGCMHYELRGALLGKPLDHVAMFDGVKIVARRPDICKHEVDWREHFGALADVWSD